MVRLSDAASHSRGLTVGQWPSTRAQQIAEPSRRSGRDVRRVRLLRLVRDPSWIWPTDIPRGTMRTTACQPERGSGARVRDGAHAPLMPSGSRGNSASGHGSTELSLPPEYNTSPDVRTRKHAAAAAARAGRTFTRPAPLLLGRHSFPHLIDTMSSRHSFLSTTGLIRPGSALSMASTVDVSANPIPTHHAPLGNTRSGRRPVVPSESTPPTSSKPLTTRAGILPLGPGFLVCIATILSLLFISCLSFAFIPDEDERPAFASDLDDVAANAPGVSAHMLISCGHTHLHPCQDRAHRG